MWDIGPANDSTRSISGAFDTFYESHLQLMTCHLPLPGSPPPLCSASCHPDSHAQASEVLRSHRPLGLRWGLYTWPQRWHRRPAEGVETTSWSSSSNMAAYRRERPQTTESGGTGAVVCPARSLWPGTVAWYRGNSDAPVGACYMMMMMNHKSGVFDSYEVMSSVKVSASDCDNDGNRKWRDWRQISYISISGSGSVLLSSQHTFTLIEYSTLGLPLEFWNCHISRDVFPVSGQFCHFLLSIVVTISRGHLLRACHGRQTKICRWNYIYVVCHSSRDISTSGWRPYCYFRLSISVDLNLIKDFLWACRGRKLCFCNKNTIIKMFKTSQPY